METELKKLEASINEFEKLQEKHLDALTDEDKLPDLEEQTLERNIGITNLMETVSGFIKKAESQNHINTKSKILFFSNRITTLLDQNKVIETKVKNIRAQLKNKMTHISKGKKIISSYRSSSAETSIKPRVLSITN